MEDLCESNYKLLLFLLLDFDPNSIFQAFFGGPGFGGFSFGGPGGEYSVKSSRTLVVTQCWPL